MRALEGSNSSSLRILSEGTNEKLHSPPQPILFRIALHSLGILVVFGNMMEGEPEPQDLEMHEESDEDKKPQDKKGRKKIKIELIEEKSRRHITFSKRKLGIMKKAWELATLTGTQVLLLVASETGHVYTFATPKLQPLITKPEGKNLIQACLNAPDPMPVMAPQNPGRAGVQPRYDDFDEEKPRGYPRGPPAYQPYVAPGYPKGAYFGGPAVPSQPESTEPTE